MMVPGGYYYKDPVTFYFRPNIAGTFSIDNKGQEKEACYGGDFEHDANYMFDLASSNSGYYLIHQKEIKTSGSAEAKPNNYYSAVHVSNEGKITKTLLTQNPNNNIENIFYPSKGVPGRNPSRNDGYNTDYQKNEDRNIFCYMLKTGAGENTYKYVWLSFE
jgi:hypothetical protein